MKMNRETAILAVFLLFGMALAMLAAYLVPQVEKVEVPQEVVAGLGRDPVGARGAHPYGS